MLNIYTSLSLFLLAFTIQVFSSRLSEDISHYEPLSYNTIEVANQHARYKRDLASNSDYKPHIELNFYAFNKNLSVILHPDEDTFHPDAIIETNGAEEKLDTSHFFKGYVQGDPGSRVFGGVTNGVFQGRIKLSDGDEYHIERKYYYSDNQDLASDRNIHSVIYKTEHVDLEKFFGRSKRAAHSSTCGNSDEKTREWMKRVQRSTAELEDGYTYLDKKTENRYRRAVDTKKTTCNLFLQADPELWKYMDRTLGGRASDTAIREEITQLFHQHVNAVQNIYTSTVFRTDSQTSFKNYGFRVDRLLVNKTCASTTDHNFCRTNLDASNLLNENSFKDHDPYCLAYVFTYRDFNRGTLGLAWVAEPGRYNGGICSRYSKRDGKSLNTGIVTLENYKQRVPASVSHITFAHELGHNFGSQHDETDNSACTDGGSGRGNYIMFSSATDGSKPNNKEFSQCSIKQIAAVLSSVKNRLNGHVDCFIESMGAHCGNQIYETDGERPETCDCGYESDCKRDVNPDCCRCCVGRGDSGDGTDQCKLKQSNGNGGTVVCDPSQGPCCNNMCGFIPRNADVTCKLNSTCTRAITCAGGQAQCPNMTEADYINNHGPCNEKTQVCRNGECEGSVCSLIGASTDTSDGNWTECEPEKIKNDATRLCFVSCREKADGRCWSSADIDKDDFPATFKKMLEAHADGEKIPRAPGHVCDSETGYCDHFQKCRTVDIQGPLARLKDLLFSVTALEQFRDQLTEYWWAVALSCVGFIALMVLVIKFCAVHTPSSNPNAPKARRLSQTLTLKRRREQQGQRDPQPRTQQRQSQPQPSGSREQPPPYTSLYTNEDEITREPPARGSRQQRQPQQLEMKNKNRKKK